MITGCHPFITICHGTMQHLYIKDKKTDCFHNILSPTIKHRDSAIPT